MQRARSAPEARRRAECGETQFSELSGLLAQLYRVWLGVALALLTLGLILDLLDDGSMETATVPLSELPLQLLEGNPAAVESIALLCATLGPVTGLLMTLAYCARRGDRRTTLLVVIVLVVVAVLPIARTIGSTR